MTNKRNSETQRTSISVPEYQHKIWKDEADELDASMSAYVRMMVQAGRKELGYSDSYSTDDDTNGNMELQVIEALQTHNGEAAYADIRNAVLGDLEEDIEEAIINLEQDGTLRTSVSSDSIELLE
jgi:hypothetical protein